MQSHCGSVVQNRMSIPSSILCVEYPMMPLTQRMKHVSPIVRYEMKTKAGINTEANKEWKNPRWTTNWGSNPPIPIISPSLNIPFRYRTLIPMKRSQYKILLGIDFTSTSGNNEKPKQKAPDSTIVIGLIPTWYSTASTHPVLTMPPVRCPAKLLMFTLYESGVFLSTKCGKWNYFDYFVQNGWQPCDIDIYLLTWWQYNR